MFRLQLTPFVGRDIELAEIATALADPTCRLLTLVGPGGIGKSRLARQVALEQAQLYADGVFFVPLAPIDTPNAIVPAIAAALGLSLTAEGHPQTQLVDLLHDKEMLLILDNFEHVLAGAGVVAELLEARAGVRVLATSREPLGFGGELLYELGGLAFPKHDDDDFALVYDAVQLFLGSARRINSSFTLTDENRPAVARVCRLLQGMPLGLELAAAWMRLLTPAELADELGRNLDVLESTRRDIPARHQSMRAVFQHSWALLSPEEQAALKRLSVFRGGFDKAAAQAVTGASLRTLLALVNKSLLGRTETGRFELLEVIRQYAEERLLEDLDAHRGARRTHAAYFLELAEQADAELTGPKQTVWLERLSAEHDNLRAAVSWALEEGEAETGLRLANAQYWYWHIRGHYHEGRAQYGHLFALPGAMTQELPYARALYCQGSLAFYQHNFAVADASTSQSLLLYRRLDDPKGIGLALWQLGVLRRDQHDFDEARSHLEEACRLQEAFGENFDLSTTYNDLAILAFYQDDFDEARELFEKSLALKRRHGDKQGIAYALGNLATLADARGDDPALIRLALEESLALKRELEDVRGIATSLINLSSNAMRLEDPEAARSYIAEGLQVAYRLDDKLRILILLSTCARLALEQRRFERVANLAGAVAALSERYDIMLPPDSRDSVARSLEAAQEQLDGAVFASARAHGGAMSLSELIACATEDEKVLSS